MTLRQGMTCLITACLALAGCNPPAKAPTGTGRNYVLQCTILDERGVVLRRFPAKMCLFLDDGSFVAATNDPIRLARIDARGKILWTRDLHVHHQLKLSEDGKTLITMGAEVKEGDLGRVRYDDFLLLSLDTGQTLRRWSGYEHRSEYLKLVPSAVTQVRPPGARESLDYLYEYTHFNSISEIPENPTARTIPAFKRGNYLVGLNGLGLFAILDANLNEIIWTMNDPLFDGDTAQNLRAFHDLQALPDGNLLLFNNEFGESRATGYFALRELDPATRKTVWRFPRDGSPQIPVGLAGGVQSTPDGILFSANFKVNGQESGAAFLLDRNGGMLWSLQQPERPDQSMQFDFGQVDLGHIKGGRQIFQDIKTFDLSQFLRKNQAK